MSATLRVKLKEKPILFSGPMIRAILEGRKTQTRRVITDERIKAFAPGYADDRGRIIGMCPYGRPGDRLWVRETYGFGWWGGQFYSAIPVTGKEKQPEKIFYKADPKWDKWDENKGQLQWRNCLFMPRFASRITLEITNIRRERLQEISRADAIAEGMQCASCNGYHSRRCVCLERFEEGWNALNAKRGYSWESNPWVWVIEFRKL